MVFRKFLRYMGLAKQPTQPTLPIDCSSNSPRVRLSDGRFLAYRERGVPKSKSNFRVIIVHGFGSSKEMNFEASQVHKFNFFF